MGKVLGLGFQFAIVVIAFGYAGSWADRRFGTGPWGVIVGAGVGFGAGFYSVYRVAMGGGDDPKTPPKGNGPR